MSKREWFYHPHTPYHIQLQLMCAIYDMLEDPGYKVGIFESPTGTGKTLSLICSTMTWLREYKKKKLVHEIEEGQGNDEDEDEDEPEWVRQQFIQNILSRQRNSLQDYEKYLNELNVNDLPVARVKDEEDQRHSHRNKRRKLEIKIENEASMSKEDDFIPADYEEDTMPQQGIEMDKNLALSNEIKSLMFQIEGVAPVNNITAVTNDTKIYYSSRTHSQLSQFATQLNILNFPSSFEDIEERLKYLPLGSRKQYCINESVNKPNKSTIQINEDCLELVNKKNSKDDDNTSCQYYPKPQDNNSTQLVKLFTDLTFTSVHDIEDLAQLGTKLSVCPYYSVRSGVDISEIISLPYQLLLEKNARDKLALKLEDSIVIIDEAHNLIDTIQAMNSISITAQQIRDINVALQSYFNMFKRKFNSGNRINLMVIMKILKSLQKFIDLKKQMGDCQDGEVFSILDVYNGGTTDLLNFYKLENYLLKSKIAYKLENYMKKAARQQQQQGLKSHNTSSSPLLFRIISFLKSLSNPSTEGKFFFGNTKTDDDLSLNYILLDPQEIFAEICERSKCIILAGGTMEPMDEYHRVLFPKLNNDQIKKFACDHVIPPKNLKTFICAGNSDLSTPFEINFKNRNNVKMFLEIARFILRAIKNIPDGVIIFFPNYKILSIAIKIWQNDGIFDEIDKLKQIFHKQEDENILENYINSVRKKGAQNQGQGHSHGAILIGVMNGKLSEGINFNDELCRCCIAIGLPYPNEFSSEMILKKKHLYNETMTLTKGDKLQSEAIVREMIDNMMIRIVNQTCGRCIRHANDYSTIILCDVRFNKVQHKLSKWIRDRVVVSSSTATTTAPSTDQIYDELKSFYVNR